MSHRNDSTTRALVDRGSWFAQIQEYLVDAATDLFHAYRNPVEHSLEGRADTHGDNVVAILGYGAQSVRGAVLLLARPSVVDALQPADAQPTTGLEHVLRRDVLGEFANMLLGRMKNQLAMRALRPMLATPTTMYGRDLVLPAPQSGLSVWHCFCAAAGPIHARLDATFEPSFALETVPGPGSGVAEGDMVLFEA